MRKHYPKPKRNCIDCGIYRQINARDRCTGCYKRLYRATIRSEEQKKRDHEGKVRATKKLKNERLRLLEIYKLERGCVDCGYKMHSCALDFDHVRGAKITNVSIMAKNPGMYTWEKIMNEIKKCEIRCANCHRFQTKQRIHQLRAEVG